MHHVDLAPGDLTHREPEAQERQAERKETEVEAQQQQQEEVEERFMADE